MLVRLSVVITNYNYARFVATAIESALGVHWPDVEIVVVDDGSTDASPNVISRYAGRVTTLFTENAGQRVAANRGFALTTGDVVVFLDSDDVLPPELPAAVEKVMSPSVSKVQFQVQPIDAEGKCIGPPYPAFRHVPTPDQISAWMCRTSAYPTPPGSGNAYSRWFLERIFPLDPIIGAAADSGCLAAAPMLGDVVTIRGIVVGYRRHNSNASNLLHDVHRIPDAVARARARWLFAQTVSGVDPTQVNEAPLYYSRELLQLRIAGRRLVPTAEPLPGDHFSRMLLDALLSPSRSGPEPLVRRLVIMAWCLATLLSPGRIAHRLIWLRWSNRR